MRKLFESALENATLLVSNLEKLQGNEHPNRKYGHFVLGTFSTEKPHKLVLESADIGDNPFSDKREKYLFLAHEKVIGNISYWRGHQDLTALSRVFTVDEELCRYLGSALTIAKNGKGVVSAFSGHPEGKIDEAIAAITNYSLGLASKKQLDEISEMSDNSYIDYMLDLYQKLK